MDSLHPTPHLTFCNVRVDWHISWQNNINYSVKSCKNMMFVLMQKRLLFKASFVKQFVAKYFYVFAIRISLWPSLVLHGQRDGHSNEEMAAMPKDRRMCMCVLHSLVFVERLHPSVAGECCNYMQLFLTSSNSTTHHWPFWPQFRQKPPRPPPTSQPSGISVCRSLMCVSCWFYCYHADGALFLIRCFSPNFYNQHTTHAKACLAINDEFGEKSSCWTDIVIWNIDFS